CLSLADGREIWRRAYDVVVRRNHGMSRTVPAVSEKFVVTLGPAGHVMCVDAVTGDFYWGIDLVREYGATIPMWHAGQCPLIVDDVAILAPAGTEVLMMGVDCATGAVLWQTPNTHGLAMSHSSIMPAEFDGIPMFVYAALGGMVGVAAAEEHRGAILWFAPQWDRSVIAPSPLVLPDGRIFVTAGYGGGSMLLQVRRSGEEFRVATVADFKPNQGLASEQQTPVMHDGHMFGILPNDAGPLRNQLACVHPDDPDNFFWTSGRENRFGLGPYLLADGKLYVLSDDGVLTMLEAGAMGYRELGRRRLLEGHDAWGPLALVQGHLVLRDDTRLMCVDLR
ncbi:MAG: PQQ-like beta-propeller repeat protein, partial [Lentisphaerae bacterium]|nr:PQQ-like beta-propeller repeat protein [Lentisphaerota bacterium]